MRHTAFVQFRLLAEKSLTSSENTALLIGRRISVPIYRTEFVPCLIVAFTNNFRSRPRHTVGTRSCMRKLAFIIQGKITTLYRRQHYNIITGH